MKETYLNSTSFKELILEYLIEEIKRELNSNSSTNDSYFL